LNFAKRFPSVANELGKGKDKFILVVMNTETVTLSFTKCLDLRRPDARKWLFETCRNGLTEFTGSFEPAPGDQFECMLPALMTPAPGGSILTQAIGLLLRRSGVQALVFPSARVDVGVIVQNGAVTDWYGWNLVDYRKAPRALRPSEAGYFVTQMPITADHLVPGGHQVDARTKNYVKNFKRHRKNPPRMFIEADSLWIPPYTRYPTVGIGEGEFTGTFKVKGIEAETHAAVSALLNMEQRE
jgi:hypothetical protein